MPLAIAFGLMLTLSTATVTPVGGTGVLLIGGLAALVTREAEFFLRLVQEALLLGRLLRRRSLADVARVRLGLRVLKLQVQVVDHEPDVHVRHRDLEQVGQLLLNGVEIVAGGNPFGHRRLLLRSEIHGRCVTQVQFPQQLKPDAPVWIQRESWFLRNSMLPRIDASCSIMLSTALQAWMTVPWSRPPNASPIS